VALFSAGNLPQFIPAVFQVNVSPADAVARGAAWQATSFNSTWIPATNALWIPTNCGGNCGTLTVQFSAVNGYSNPAPISVNLTQWTGLTAGPTNRIFATYTLLPSRLAVTPAVGLSSSGSAGGPFSNSSLTYTLANQGGSNLIWNVTKTAPWLSVSTASGTLGLGSNTTVLVNLNNTANTLAAGTYTDTLVFTNTSPGNLGSTNFPVTLNVIGSSALSTLSVPKRLANGSLQFTLVGNIGKVYSIEFSTNLTNWSDLPILLTNQNGTNFFTNTPPPGVGTGFFRAKEQ
jgi:hypothetical protein